MRARRVSINSSAGAIRHASIGEFIRSVDYNEWEEDSLTVYIRNRDFRLFDFNQDANPWIPKQFVFDKKPIKNQLVSQLEETQLIFEGLRTVQEAAIRSMHEMGAPKVMVRISTRLWLLANPDDFRIFDRNGKVVLVCLHPKRNLLIRLLRPVI